MDEVKKMNKKLSLSLKECLELYLEKIFQNKEKDYVVFSFLGINDIVVGRNKDFIWMSNSDKDGFIWWVDGLELKTVEIEEKIPTVLDDLSSITDDIYSFCSSLC